MNKVAVVLGVAAVATLAGCKDPNMVKANAGSQEEVKNVPIEETAKPAPEKTETAPVKKEAASVAKPTCKCPPGTKHTSPCKCGAEDCKCIVEVKPVKPAEPEFTIYYVQNGDYLAKISKKFNITIASIKKLNNLTSDTIRVGQKLKLPGKVDVGEQGKPTPVAASQKPVKKGYAPYVGATKEYVVKNGDTLGGIAYSNGINIRQLKELNSLTKDTLQIGQKLKIPAEKVVKATPKAVAKPAAPVAAPKAEAKAAESPAPEVKPEAPKAEEKAAESPAPEVKDAPAPVAETAQPEAPVQTAATDAAAPMNYVVQPNEDIQAVAIRFAITTAEIRELNNLGENDVLKAGQVIKLPAEAQQ